MFVSSLRQFAATAKHICSLQLDKICMNLETNSHTPCRAPAVPCRANRAVLQPCSDSAVFFVKFRAAAGKIRTASPVV